MRAARARRVCTLLGSKRRPRGHLTWSWRAHAVYKKVAHIAAQYYKNRDHLNERLREQYGADLSDIPASPASQV